MASKKSKQATLFQFKFTRSVKHRGKLVEVPGEDFVAEDADYYTLRCDTCRKGFKNRAGLTMHVAWCEAKRVEAKDGKAVPDSTLGIVAVVVKSLISTVVMNEKQASNEIQKECKSVLENLLDSLCPKPSETKHRRGSDTRRSYSIEFKAMVIEEASHSTTSFDVDVAQKYGISKSMLSKWKRNKQNIENALGDKYKKLLKKNRPSTKHKEIFKKLHERFVTARSKGRKISYAWFYANANKINLDLNEGAKRLPKSAVTRFIKQYNIKLRRVQRKKQKNKGDFLPKIMQWHTTLREGVIKSKRSSLNYHSKWGRFKPDRRFNVDQVPMPFCIDRTTTYELNVEKTMRRDHRVWVSNPGPGLEKRQCTLQICISPQNKVRIAIIFRGTGKRISPAETAAYHKGVDVYWQENAWADTNFSVEWIERTLKPAIEKGTGDGEFLLYLDNLKAQTSDEFRAALHKISGVEHYGVAGATDIWQPVDCGIGRILKNLVSHEQDEWLEFDENIELWLGNSEDKLNASKRRILITHWVGVAYEKLMGGQYARSLYRSFEKTGCLITADGSDDSKVNPEGLPGYVLPPPLPTPALEEAIQIDVPQPDENIPEEGSEFPLCLEYDAQEEDEIDDSLPERIDNANDRVENHPLKNAEVKVLYEEWHIGVITWYNKVLDEYRLEFPDGTDDYIKLDAIDGVECILLS